MLGQDSGDSSRQEFPLPVEWSLVEPSGNGFVSHVGVGQAIGFLTDDVTERSHDDPGLVSGLFDPRSLVAILPLIRTLRITQWVKNVFVLLPLVFAEELVAAPLLMRASILFVAFCGLSSSVYILNDLADRARDRLHPVKRLRPLASGALKPEVAIATLVVMLLASLAVCYLLGRDVLAVATTYLLLNLLYSVGRMKDVVIVDVMIVSSGYVLRVLAGGFATDVHVSDWMILCTTFLALFLTFSKRRHELMMLAERARDQRVVLDHYSLELLDQMSNVVTASTLLAYSLYATSPETAERFGTPYFFILTIPFVLYGIFRFLYLSHQQSAGLNPTEAMLRDLPFVVNVALWGMMVLGILYVF